MAEAMLGGQMAVLDRLTLGADWADWVTARSRAVRAALLSYRDVGRLQEYARPVCDPRPTRARVRPALVSDPR